MDFTDRGMRPNQQTNSGGSLGSAPSQGDGPSKKPSRFHKLKNHKLLNITYITLLFSATVLIVGVVLLIFFYDGKDKEVDYVDTDRYQAVFLNGGQVYFGKIVELNSQYMSLTDIYYLTPNQAVQSDGGNAAANNFTIRKLGCELHRPQDVMVVNHDQIVFWENLKEDDSQNTVPGAIKQLADQPQDCNAQQNQSTNGSTTDNGSTETNSTTDNGSTDSSGTTNNSDDGSSSSSNSNNSTSNQ